MRVTVLYNHDFEDGAAHVPGDEHRAEIALVAEGIAAALARLPRTEPTLLPCHGPALRFARLLVEDPPDLVFNLCESLEGDSRGELAVPALLDALGIPYTGSPALALGLALHKHKAKDVLRAHGVPTPDAVVIRRRRQLEGATLPLPAIVKPAREDASIGIGRSSLVRTPGEARAQVIRILEEHRQEALVERYVEGREIYAAVLGNDPPELLPLTEIDFSALPADLPRIVTYEAKWNAGSVEDLGTRPVLARVDDEALRARIAEVALAAFEALEMRDYGRVDLRVDAAGVPQVIDLNPNCDLAAGAGFARAAAAAGMSYDALVARLVQVAQARLHGDPTGTAQRPPAARRAARANRELQPRRGRVRARALGAGPRREP